MLTEKALVESSFNSSHSRAWFLAACAEHSGDWLFALPLASCGLHLDDEAVRVAVCLRLGLESAPVMNVTAVQLSTSEEFTASSARRHRAR